MCSKKDSYVRQENFNKCQYRLKPSSIQPKLILRKCLLWNSDKMYKVADLLITILSRFGMEFIYSAPENTEKNWKDLFTIMLSSNLH